FIPVAGSSQTMGKNDHRSRGVAFLREVDSGGYIPVARFVMPFDRRTKWGSSPGPEGAERHEPYDKKEGTDKTVEFGPHGVLPYHDFVESFANTPHRVMTWRRR